MRLGTLLIAISVAGCSLLPESHHYFPIVVSQKSETDPELIYGCVSSWLQYQDQMILTSKSSQVHGWNGDKNHIFSVHADGKKVNLFVAVTTDSTKRKLQQMVRSCANDAASKPPSTNFWAPYYQASIEKAVRPPMLY